MNFIEYEKEKLKSLSAEELIWKKFKITGSCNDAMFLLAVSGMSRGKEWMSTNLKEL